MFEFTLKIDPAVAELLGLDGDLSLIHIWSCRRHVP